MPDALTLRYYCLNAADRIVDGADLDATDRPTAIREATQACREHMFFPTTRIEIWRGVSRLYRSHGA